jgi:hypothetical protein
MVRIGIFSSLASGWDNASKSPNERASPLSVHYTLPNAVEEVGCWTFANQDEKPAAGDNMMIALSLGRGKPFLRVPTWWLPRVNRDRARQAAGPSVSAMPR